MSGETVPLPGAFLARLAKHVTLCRNHSEGRTKVTRNDPGYPDVSGFVGTFVVRMCSTFYYQIAKRDYLYKDAFFFLFYCVTFNANTLRHVCKSNCIIEVINTLLFIKCTRGNS